MALVWAYLSILSQRCAAFIGVFKYPFIPFSCIFQHQSMFEFLYYPTFWSFGQRVKCREAFRTVYGACTAFIVQRICRGFSSTVVLSFHIFNLILMELSHCHFFVYLIFLKFSPPVCFMTYLHFGLLTCWPIKRHSYIKFCMSHHLAWKKVTQTLVESHGNWRVIIISMIWQD